MKKRILTALAVMMSVSAFSQINVKTEKGDMNVRFIGRTNFDAGTYISSSEADMPERNGISMNDTRLGVTTTFDEKWSSKIEVCYANKAISFRDLWIGYQLTDNSKITVGNHFQPYGAKILGLAYKFVEDASADYAFCPSRKIGVSYAYASNKLNVTAGLFSDGNVDNGKNVNKGYSIAAKAIFRPISEDESVLHFGFAQMFVDSPNDLTFNGIIPNTVISKTLASAKFDQTDDVEWYTRVEAEALFIKGKFYAEAHYLGTYIRFPETDDDFSILDHYNDGWYAQASYLIKGEKQNYNKKTGLAASASPKSLEVLARISNIDLRDWELLDKQTDFTLGVNYFFNKNLNVKLNYIYAKVKGNDTENRYVENDYNMIQTRLQFSF